MKQRLNCEKNDASLQEVEQVSWWFDTWLLQSEQQNVKVSSSKILNPKRSLEYDDSMKTDLNHLSIQTAAAWLEKLYLREALYILSHDIFWKFRGNI